MTAPKSKTLYDEAIADVKKLKELAETQARDLVLQKVEPRIKQLVEQQLFQESEDDEDEMDEASTTANVQGYIAPLGMDPEKPKDKLAEDDEQYEVAEGTESTLAQLADFARPITDDRFVAEVYRLQESVNGLVTAEKAEKLTDKFVSQLDSTILKLEDMYAYLKESYAGKDGASLEGKLEKSYGLVNAVKESTMKMRDLLNEETLTLKVNGLPDDVDLDTLTVDVVADEGDEAGAEGAPDMGGEDMGAMAPPAPPQMESDSDDDDDEMLEISDAELKAELGRLGALREGDATPPETKGHGHAGVLDDFGDADDEGHLGPKGKRPEGIPDDAMNESDDDDDDDRKDETQNRRTHDDHGDKDEYGAKVNESDDDADDRKDEGTKMESVRRRLTRAATRLSEARGTDKEDFARAMYRSAIRAYRSARANLNEGSAKASSNKKTNSAPAAKNTATSKELTEVNGKVTKLTKQLVEANLLNAKLIHANKLLRLEGLTKAQQAMVIDRLDEAQNLREVRLISESLQKVLAGSKDSLTESARRPSGSASRPSQSGAATSQPLTEGLETARWAQLAGLK